MVILECGCDFDMTQIFCYFCDKKIEITDENYEDITKKINGRWVHTCSEQCLMKAYLLRDDDDNPNDWLSKAYRRYSNHH